MDAYEFGLQSMTRSRFSMLDARFAGGWDKEWRSGRVGDQEEKKMRRRRERQRASNRSSDTGIDSENT